MMVLITTSTGRSTTVDYDARSALSAVMAAVHDDLDGYTTIERAFCEFDEDEGAVTARKYHTDRWLIEWQGEGFNETITVSR